MEGTNSYGGEPGGPASPGAKAGDRYAEILDAPPDFVGTTDAGGRTLSVNPAGRRMLGFDGDEDLSGVPITRYHPGWAQQVILGEGIPAALRDGTWEGETALLSRDGREIPVSQVIVAHRGEGGETEYLSTIAWDVSGRKRAEEALREQNRRTERILESITDAFVTLDNHWRFTYLNPEAERVLLRSHEELIGRNVWEAFPEAVGSTFHREYFRAKAGGVAVEFEEFYQPLGTWLAVKAYPSRDGMAVYFRDVSGRKEAEEERERLEKGLRKYAERLSSVVATQQEIAASRPDLAAVMDLVAGRMQGLTGADGAAVELAEGQEMVYRAASGTAAPHVGLRLKTDSSLSGRCLRSGEILRCDDTEDDPRVDREACRRIGARSMVVVPLAHAGRIVGVLKVISSEADAFGDGDVDTLRLMAGMIAAAMSHIGEHEARRTLLEERTAALARTRESEARFRAIFEGAGIGVAIVDLGGSIVQSNPALQRILGFGEAELRGRTIAEITHPEDMDADMELFEELMAGKRHGYQMEKRYIRKDGHPVWGRLSVSLVRGSDAGPQVVIGMVEDITERKKAEEELRESEVFARSTLNSLSAHIAILDGTGLILATNRAWQGFAASNPPITASAGTGANYLEVCEGATGEHSEEAAAFVRGIRDVIAGRRDSFELEYPCHSPDEKRWFIGRVTRFPDSHPPMVVVAHENITQRKLAEEEIKLRARQQKAVADLGRRALALDLTALMDEAVSVVAGTLGVEYCKVLELLPDGDELLLAAGVGWREGLTGNATVGASRHSQAGFTLLSDGPVVVEDLRTEGRFSGPPLLHEHGVVSGMSAIVRGRERPFGVLGAHTKRRRTFTGDDVHFLRSVANVLGAAVERERAERAMDDVREAERRRMARDLHDGALQGITYALVEVQLAQLISEDPSAADRLGKADGRLGKAAEALLRSADELREAVYDLHPADADGRPFGEAVGEVLAAARRMSPGLETDLSVDERFPESLPGATGRELLRILQEAVTNARKHSGAGLVRVVLRGDEHEVRAEVADDGRGFDSGAAGGGLGQTSMGERAAALGGTLAVESAQGKGTRVVFRMPDGTPGGT